VILPQPRTLARRSKLQVKTQTLSPSPGSQALDASRDSNPLYLRWPTPVFNGFFLISRCTRRAHAAF
jgi:hypothetical protein